MVKQTYVRFKKGNKELYIKCEDSAEAIKTIQRLVQKDSNREQHKTKEYTSINIIKSSYLDPSKHTLTTLEKVLSE